MKKKMVLAIIVFITLIIGIVFVNSYVQALSKQERLQIDREEGINANCQRRNNQYSHGNYHCSKDYNRGRCHR